MARPARDEAQDRGPQRPAARGIALAQLGRDHARGVLAPVHLRHQLQSSRRAGFAGQGRLHAARQPAVGQADLPQRFGQPIAGPQRHGRRRVPRSRGHRRRARYPGSRPPARAAGWRRKAVLEPCPRRTARGPAAREKREKARLPARAPPRAPSPAPGGSAPLAPSRPRPAPSRRCAARRARARPRCPSWPRSRGGPGRARCRFQRGQPQAVQHLAPHRLAADPGRVRQLDVRFQQAAGGDGDDVGEADGRLRVDGPCRAKPAAASVDASSAGSGVSAASAEEVLVARDGHGARQPQRCRGPGAASTRRPSQRRPRRGPAGMRRRPGLGHERLLERAHGLGRALARRAALHAPAPSARVRRAGRRRAGRARPSSQRHDDPSEGRAHGVLTAARRRTRAAPTSRRPSCCRSSESAGSCGIQPSRPRMRSESGRVSSGDAGPSAFCQRDAFGAHRGQVHACPAHDVRRRAAARGHPPGAAPRAPARRSRRSASTPAPAGRDRRGSPACPRPRPAWPARPGARSSRGTALRSSASRAAGQGKTMRRVPSRSMT